MPPPKTSTLAHTSCGCYSFCAFRRSSAELTLLRFPRGSLTHRWGVVQLVGHLTVNEDGEGSNPSAPANFAHKFEASPANPALSQPMLRVIPGRVTVVNSGLMRRVSLLFLALALLLPIQNAAARQLARPEVPEKLAAPISEKAILQAHATGSQIYVCQAGPDQKLSWILKGPEAELFDSQNKVIGKHFVGPTWKLNDGSEATGKVAVRQDSPEADSIPWLLLTVTSHSGTGSLATVTFIQRIHTKGGQPPASGCDDSHRGAETKAAYSADYYFYAPAH
jgi:Protein of unknown function (DUF3455)